jgi:hypothetical protein
VSLSVFVLVDAILLVGNHTISEYLRKRSPLMAAAVVLFIIAAFLSGAVTAVFAMLVVGVYAGDRPRHLTAQPPRGRLEALTRTVLGVGVRTGDNPED